MNTLSTNEQIAENIADEISLVALTRAWEVERIGTWVWVSQTDVSDMEGRNFLKSKGLKWSAKKKAWFYMDKANKGRRMYAKNLDSLRSIHGSERLA
jgi:hypothetical protein